MTVNLYNDLEKKFKEKQLQRNADSLRLHHPENRMEMNSINTEIKNTTKDLEKLGAIKLKVSKKEAATHFEKIGYKVRYEEPFWAIINTLSKVSYVVERFPTMKDLGIDEEEEVAVPFYRQCTFQQDTKTQVAWIDEMGIRLGSRVRFKDDDSGWWKVTTIGDHRMPEVQARVLERQYLKHRETTDI